jgi:hypothetical protein
MIPFFSCIRSVQCAFLILFFDDEEKIMPFPTSSVITRVDLDFLSAASSVSFALKNGFVAVACLFVY